MKDKKVVKGAWLKFGVLALFFATLGLVGCEENRASSYTKNTVTELLSYQANLLNQRTNLDREIQDVFEVYPLAATAVTLQNEGLSSFFSDLNQGKMSGTTIVKSVGPAIFCNLNEENVRNCNKAYALLEDISGRYGTVESQLMLVNQRLAQ